MSHYMIVVVNRTCARFFTFEPVEFPELESGPRLMTRAEVENSEIEDVQEMYMDFKTGRGFILGSPRCRAKARSCVRAAGREGTRGSS